MHIPIGMLRQKYDFLPTRESGCPFFPTKTSRIGEKAELNFEKAPQSLAKCQKKCNFVGKKCTSLSTFSSEDGVTACGVRLTRQHPCLERIMLTL